jgi:hypothetical protein
MIVMTREPTGISVKIESHAQRLTQACDTLCVRYKQPFDIAEILLNVALCTNNQSNQ